MKTEIIVIGDELLIGQVIDTNSAWMAAELNHVGWDVCRVVTVRDEAHAITEAIESALSNVDAVLMTGGLGPTSDDITKPTLCRYFGGKMRFDESVYEQARSLMERLTFTAPSSRRKRRISPAIFGTA